MFFFPISKFPASNFPPSKTIGFYSIWTDQPSMSDFVSGFSESYFNKFEACSSRTFGSGFVVAERSLIKPILVLYAYDNPVTQHNSGIKKIYLVVSFSDSTPFFALFPYGLK